MTLNFRFFVVLLGFVLGACGGESPTKPSSTVLPSGMNPPTVLTEIYEFPESYISTSQGILTIPAGCFKSEVRKISPGRNSLIPFNYEPVNITVFQSICPDAPVLSKGYKFSYYFVDENGSQITPWLTGSLGDSLNPGRSQLDQWGSKAYVPFTRIPFLQIKIYTDDHGYVVTQPSATKSPDVSILVPLEWRMG